MIPKALKFESHHVYFAKKKNPPFGLHDSKDFYANYLDFLYANMD